MLVEESLTGFQDECVQLLFVALRVCFHLLHGVLLQLAFHFRSPLVQISLEFLDDVVMDSIEVILKLLT